VFIIISSASYTNNDNLCGNTSCVNNELVISDILILFAYTDGCLYTPNVYTYPIFHFLGLVKSLLVIYFDIEEIILTVIDCYIIDVFNTGGDTKSDGFINLYVPLSITLTLAVPSLSAIKNCI